MTRGFCAAQVQQARYTRCMDMIWTEIGLQSLLIACIVALFAGLIKGIVGFALPTVMISGLSAVMSPELALAALIMPTVAANGWQAVRDGFAPAWQVIVRFRVFLLVGGVALVISAQLFTVLLLPHAIIWQRPIK